MEVHAARPSFLRQEADAIHRGGPCAHKGHDAGQEELLLQRVLAAYGASRHGPYQHAHDHVFRGGPERHQEAGAERTRAVQRRGRLHGLRVFGGDVRIRSQQGMEDFRSTDQSSRRRPAGGERRHEQAAGSLPAFRRHTPRGLHSRGLRREDGQDVRGQAAGGSDH